MRITLEVKAEVIANMMCSAVESGDPVTNAEKGGWCAGIWPVGNSEKRAKQFTHWYAEPAFWQDGALIDIFEVIEDGKAFSIENRRNVRAHRINKAGMAQGLRIMAEKYPHVFAQVIQDNTDAPCADIFLQCMCFGEEKYA